MKSELRKRVLFFLGLILGSALLFYPLNLLVLGSTAETLPFSLLGVYVFFSVSALIIYLALEFLVAYIGDKIAYLFLFTVMIKLGLFLVLFFGNDQSKVVTPLSGKLSMLFALFIFLSIEGFATYKVLISNQDSEN